MTQNEFYQRTLYIPKANEKFDFWEMHEDYIRANMNKDEYCQKWLEDYRFFGFAKGIHNECTECIDMAERKADPYEEWINTPDKILYSQGIPTHDCVWYGEKLKSMRK